MNTERLLQLADVVENTKHFDIGNRLFLWRIRPIDGFNMGSYICETPCGTAGCLAGHAAALFGEAGAIHLDEIFSAAAGLLDLNYAEASHLFVPNDASYCDITPAWAATACRKLAEGVPPEEIWH